MLQIFRHVMVHKFSEVERLGLVGWELVAVSNGVYYLKFEDELELPKGEDDGKPKDKVATAGNGRSAASKSR